jgi:V/A-type H+-transporting ATPase subunit E
MNQTGKSSFFNTTSYSGQVFPGSVRDGRILDRDLHFFHNGDGMSDTLNTLIEKIQREGIEEAEAKAQQIETEASERARRMIEEAKTKADLLLSETRHSIDKIKKSEETALKHAGRNLLISLRQEINATLLKVIKEDIRETLSDEMLYGIIERLILEQSANPKNDIVVILTPQELTALGSFLVNLQERIKKCITLQHSDQFDRGFVISYDAGKSYFDFSDHALGEAVMKYLKPRLAAILNEPTSSEPIAL